MKTASQECHPSGSYVAIFSSIHYVLKAEQLLKGGNIALDVVPVPGKSAGIAAWPSPLPRTSWQRCWVF